jgi:hypothetical protein
MVRERKRRFDGPNPDPKSKVKLLLLVIVPEKDDETYSNHIMYFTIFSKFRPKILFLLYQKYEKIIKL